MMGKQHGNPTVSGVVGERTFRVEVLGQKFRIEGTISPTSKNF